MPFVTFVTCMLLRFCRVVRCALAELSSPKAEVCFLKVSFDL